MVMQKYSADRRMRAFLEKTIVVDGHRIWTGTTNQYGYGRFWDGSRLAAAHRWIYEQHHGEIASRDLMVMHSCDTPACVTLEHLSVGTAKDNCHDMIRKGRAAFAPPGRGELRPTAKLTESAVLEIRYRAAAGERLLDLAGDFGVTPGLVSHIVTGISWKHVGGPRRPRPRSRRGLRIGEFRPKVLGIIAGAAHQARR